MLVDALVDANGPELLVARLGQLDDAASEEDAKAVQNCMEVFENLVEVRPRVAVDGWVAGSWRLGRVGWALLRWLYEERQAFQNPMEVFEAPVEVRLRVGGYSKCVVPSACAF